MNQTEGLSYRENFIRTIAFKRPQWLIADIYINTAVWAELKESLAEVAARHPAVFRYREGSVDYQSLEFSTEKLDDNYVTDVYGCKWHYPLRYLDGVCIGHPLEDLAALDAYVPPASPVKEMGEAEWAEEKKKVAEAKARGEIVQGGTEHGFLFLRHTYLRGFENAMMDYADEDARPALKRIYDMIYNYNRKLVDYHIRRGSDLMYFAEDLGDQNGAILGPALFREWVKPVYTALMQPCKRAGMFVGLHSDGKTLDILEDHIEAGVDMVNPQDLLNGIDNLARRIKGKACIQLDIDRQSVMPFGSPKDVDDLIHEEMEKLGSPEGGLSFVCGIYPGTPPENIEALATALEKYSTMWLPLAVNADFVP
jgi:hypothetical protein